MSGKGYTYTGSGTNSQVRIFDSFVASPALPSTNKGSSFFSKGNHYCSRQGNDGGSGYHYSNTNGSYYYANTNGSTYYNSGKGSSTYTSPSGYTVSKSSGK
uniref:Uncharacterized protein n=1 Tax=Psilocybe cubensis TaxID=181762 RepID=A0A8H7Y2S5_PSICU